MKVFILALSILLAGPFAMAKPYMKCTHITPSRQKVIVSIDLVKTKIDPASDHISDLTLKIEAVHDKGEKRSYADSFGWIREDGIFNFSFCQKGKCSMSLSGQITAGQKVKNADLIAPTDALTSSRSLTSCGLLIKK